MSQPSARSASTRSPIGRSCIRGTPAAVRRRPARERRGQRAKRGAGVARGTGRAARTGNAPPAPSTTSRCRAIVATRHRARAARRASGPCRRSRARRRASWSRGQRRQQQRAVGDALRAGQRHVPSACARGGETQGVRCGIAPHSSLDVSVAERRFPRAARAARAARRSARAPRRRRRRARAQPLERVRYRVDFGEQRVAIGERDVAPHLRRARGDAREVAKAAARMREICAASGRAASSATSANASTCGRCDTAAKIASCSSAARAPRRARRTPATSRSTRCQRRRPSRQAASRITLRPSNSVGDRRGGADCSVPAIGWAGTNAASAAPKAARAACDDVLLRAAGVGHAPCRHRSGASSREQRRILRDRVATSTTSASRARAAQRRRARSAVDDAAARARRRDSPRERPTPTTRRRRRRRASAPARTSRR